MTGRQTAVLWMGLILVMLNVFTGQAWKDIKAVLFSTPTTNAKGKKSPPSPILPFIPTTPLSPIFPGSPISTPSNATVNPSI